jgi:tRNA dimethylallyltransferase
MIAPSLALLVGATATGKTDLALEAVAIAPVPVEIVSLDSRQLYRGLDVGTGKATPAQLAAAPHHMVNVLALTETFDAAAYRRAVDELLPAIFARGAVPLFVGGAGFYLRALREGFLDLDFDARELTELRVELDALPLDELQRRLEAVDPVTAERLHPHDRYRIGRALEIQRLSGVPASDHEKSFVPRPVLGADFDVVLLSSPRQLLHERIALRTAHWIGHGWREEVETLRASGVPPDCPGLKILGYRQVGEWIDGGLDEAGCETEICTRTRRYARQQETWFRKEDPRWCGQAQDSQAVDALVQALVESRDRGPS